MAIKIYEQFAPFANPADGDYPQGSFKNDSIPGAEDGTPLDAVWANDYAGTDAELFAQAGIVPSGQPDKLGASQRVDAMKRVIGKSSGLCFDSVASMVSSIDLSAGLSVSTRGYYLSGDGGGGDYIIDNTSVADGYCDIDLGDGLTAVLQGTIIDIRKAGCKPGDYSFDNVARIKSAILKGRGLIPAGLFYSSPIRLGIAFNNKSLVGLGISSSLGLISSATTGGVPLLHIPQNGGVYGGTEVGAIGFFADNFSMSGLDATATTSTTGLVVENSVAFRFGTLWTFGFYKSGALFVGTCTLLKGQTIYSYNNGNQVGASTGGQGVAFSLTDSADPQGKIDNIIGFNNGAGNFGQALDWVEGNLHVGTLHGYNNGASCMKIVRAAKARIDTFISKGNNTHVGNGFPALYTNGDFGELSIGHFQSDGSAASGLLHSKSGVITIENAEINDSASVTISLTPDVGKVAKLVIGTLTASNTTLSFINQTNNSSLTVGAADLTGGPVQGIILNGTETTIGSLKIKDNIGTPLWLRGGDISITTTKIERTDLAGSTATLIDVGVSNASLLNLKTKGYTTPLTDKSLTTYKPNVVNI